MTASEGTGRRGHAGMHPVLEHLYSLLHRGADTATRFFKLPADRVYEVGTPVEL